MLKNAYDFLKKKGYDLPFPYNKLVSAVSYDCEDLIDELREEVMLYDWNTPTQLYFKTDRNGLIIFYEYKMPGDKFKIQGDCIVIGVMDVLRVLTLQNDMFDRTLAEIDKANGFE